MKQPEFVYDQAVIVEILLGGLEEHGNKDDHDLIARMEKEICDLLPAKTGIDGHEFGEGEATIYIYGPSADNAFAAIEKLLKKSSFERIDIILQYGLPDDPKTKEKKFTL